MLFIITWSFVGVLLLSLVKLLLLLKPVLVLVLVVCLRRWTGVKFFNF